eukprot:3418657-Rhodomonas_salina.1
MQADGEQQAKKDAEEEQKVGKVLLEVMRYPNTTAKIRKLVDLLRSVKSKRARKKTKGALSMWFADGAWDEVKKILVSPSESRFTDAWFDRCNKVEEELTLSLFYDKRNPEALGSRGLLSMVQNIYGPGLRDLLAALAVKDDLGRWRQHSKSTAFQQGVGFHKNWQSGEWKEIAMDHSPKPRSQAAYCHDNAGRFYLFGGMGRMGFIFGDIWVLDMRSDSWEWKQIETHPESGPGSADRIHMARSAA